MLKNRNIKKISKFQETIRKKLLKKFDDNIYQIIDDNLCEVCNKNDFETLTNFDSWGFPTNTSICKSCGMVKLTKKIKKENYSDFYENYYRELYRGYKKPSEDLFELEKYKAKRILNFISKSIELNKVKSCLDVGCGSGATSVYFSDYFKTTGIDLDPYNTFHSLKEKNNNLEIKNISIFDSYLDDKKYDFISYCHVLEHVYDIDKELERVHNLLSENGYLYVELPGINKIYKWTKNGFFDSLHIAHTYYFTLGTLKNFLNKKNFELVNGNELISSLWKKKNDITFNLYNHYPNIKKKLYFYDNKILMYFWKFLLEFLERAIRLAKLILKKLKIFNIVKYFFLKYVKKNKLL